MAMALKLSLLLIAVVCVASLAWWRGRVASRTGAGIVFEPEDDSMDLLDSERYGMEPNAAAFVIELVSPISLKNRRLELRGRLQIYVRRGSQYATWRQFPNAIHYELLSPSGASAMSEDFSLSISDSTESYDHYAAQAADQIVGQNFEEDVFHKVSQLLPAPGPYRIRAHHMGAVSNWLDLEVAP